MSVPSGRLKAAARAACLHLLASVLVAASAAALVFLVWYPHPYGLLSGGLNLFLILVGVDVVCGPLLTLVLFNPRKPRRELFTDLVLVALIQLGALAYGLHTVYEARPLYLVHEVDRFRVIAWPDFGDGAAETEARAAIARLDASLRPHPFKGPVAVGIRQPKDAKERQEVMFESIAGGRDYAQRPGFYLPYDDVAYRPTALARARPLSAFVARYPGTAYAAAQLLRPHGVAPDQALFLPVLHRQEWVAVLDPATARILGFLPGDGFAVP